jgi:hypothetical protein
VQRRHQHRFDLREKTWTIDRPVEDCRPVRPSRRSAAMTVCVCQ